MCLDNFGMIILFAICREKYLAATWSVKSLVNWQTVKLIRTVDEETADISCSVCVLCIRSLDMISDTKTMFQK